jgi:thiamine-phosphate pyrophosphorylase
MSITTGEERRDRLGRARLYLVCGPHPGGREAGDVLAAALAGGVDVVQLRDKDAGDDDLLCAAGVFAERCAEAGALFVLNDRPDLVAAAGADGVHLGQADVPVPEARVAVGAERLVGLSTHSAAQLDAAAGVDYVAVGPVHATPTKPGRPAVGLAPVRHAAAQARVPFFAIGGIDPANVHEVIGAGARRIVVVRAIAEADDPEAAARALRTALDAAWEEAPLGAA